MRNACKYALTAAIVLGALGLGLWRYQAYLLNPWIRDGRVMANIIQIAPRVSGPVVDLPIVDNQRVKAGDLLFRIDPRTYDTDLALARAGLDRAERDLLAFDKQVTAAETGVAQAKAAITQAQSNVTAQSSTLAEAEKELRRNAALLKTDDVPQARYDAILRDYQVDLAAKQQSEAALLGAQSRRDQAEAELASAEANHGEPGPDNARLRAARAQLETARLNMGFTEMRAPVDGMISNLNIRLGSQAVANQPFMALIDENSFRIDANFRETLIADSKSGDPAIITLMSNSGTPLRGHVDSIGWGIASSDGSTAPNLLPNVSPTFQWIRLAQRLPVRVQIDDIPKGVVLRVGQTASVLVQTTAGTDISTPAPAALQ